jgi:hypothetical protein
MLMVARIPVRSLNRDAAVPTSSLKGMPMRQNTMLVAKYPPRKMSSILELAVVSLPGDGRVEGVSFYGCQPRVRDGEVPLLVVVEADHGTDVLGEVTIEAPGE